MTAEKQRKAYGILILFIVVLLLAVQYGLLYMLRQSGRELVSLQSALAYDRGQLDSQIALSSGYDAFRGIVSEHTDAGRRFPANGALLFQALNSVMNDYNIDFVNVGSTARGQYDSDFTLQIRFSGQYYDLIKALAAIRESEFIMRLSELNVSAEGSGAVSGIMSIISLAARTES